MTIESFLTVLMVGLAQGSFAFIIVKSPVFSGLKAKVVERANSEFLAKMLDCPYCFGTWVAMFAGTICWLTGVQVFPFRSPLFEIFAPFVLWLAITTISGLTAGILMGFYQFHAPHRPIQRLDDEDERPRRGNYASRTGDFQDQTM